MSTRRQGRSTAATVHDVAREAGVSPMTVSRVVNNAPGVAATTRAHVQQVITQLGFAPNRAARSLRARRSLWIALVFQRTSGETRDDPAYVTELQEGVIGRCLENGYHSAIELISADTHEASVQLRELAQQLAPDGMLLAPPLSTAAPLLQELQALHVPFVRITPATEEGAGPCVVIDDRAAARQMTEYLLSMGHRRIACVQGHPEHPSSAPRLAGYQAGLAEWGVRGDPALIVPGDFRFAGGQQAAATLLDLGTDAPTAIFACNDESAAGCLAEAHARRIRVPEELSIVGFDDTYVTPMLYPPLTTIRQSIREMGQAAAGQLLALIDGLEPPATIRMPHRLVERQSAAPPPGHATGQPRDPS